MSEGTILDRDRLERMIMAVLYKDRGDPKLILALKELSGQAANPAAPIAAFLLGDDTAAARCDPGTWDYFRSLGRKIVDQELRDTYDPYTSGSVWGNIYTHTKVLTYLLHAENRWHDWARIGGWPTKLPSGQEPLPWGIWPWAWFWKNSLPVVQELFLEGKPATFRPGAVEGGLNVYLGLVMALNQYLGWVKIEPSCAATFIINVSRWVTQPGLKSLESDQGPGLDGILYRLNTNSSDFTSDHLQVLAEYWKQAAYRLGERGLRLASANNPYQRQFVQGVVDNVPAHGDWEAHLGGYVDPTTSPVEKFRIVSVQRNRYETRPNDPFGPKVNPFFEALEELGLSSNPPFPTYEVALDYLDQKRAAAVT